MSAPAAEVNVNAPMMGLTPVTSPSVIPVSDACASVSPISEYRRNTRKIPISGQRMPIKNDTIKAFCIKAYFNIAAILSNFTDKGYRGLFHLIHPLRFYL